VVAQPSKLLSGNLRGERQDRVQQGILTTAIFSLGFA
jgi:hypothetical protein